MNFSKPDGIAVKPEKTWQSFFNEKEIFIARLSIKYGFASKKNIYQILSIYKQKKLTDPDADLGQLLIINGVISASELDFILSVRKMSQVTELDRSFAALAIKNELVSLNEIKQAFKKQDKIFKKSYKIKLLGDILVDSGYMTVEYRDAILGRQQRLGTRHKDEEWSFGTIAIEENFTTQNEIDQALQRQYEEFEKTKNLKLLGDILVDSGMITRKQRNIVLSHQKKLKLESMYEKKQSKEEKESFSETDESAVSLMNDYLEITISKDLLEAHILVKKKLPIITTVDDIKNFVRDKGIQYGMVDDSVIADYIMDEFHHTQPWRIAKGKTSSPPVHNKIKYYFDTDPLNINLIKSGSAFEFAENKEISSIKKGDLVAEKIPGVKGKAGISIFGELIEAEKPLNVKISCGKGAKLSTDKNQAVAAIDGIPYISFQNKIYVLPKEEIRGDISIKTGDVYFDGELNVLGTVGTGFKVRAGRLVSREIMKAKISTDSDIVVSGGIIGATIKTNGNVKARFIKGAKIEALGDVVVQREVIDSNIESGGECIIQKGMILSSQILAYNGLSSEQVGSNSSPPCTLTVGINTIIKKRSEELSWKISEKEKKIKKLSEPMSEINFQLEQIESKIKELNKIKKRALALKPALREKIQSIKIGGELSQLQKTEFKKTEMMIISLNSKIKSTDENLKIFYKKRNQILSRISKYHNEIQKQQQIIHELEEEILSLSEWSKNEKGRSDVIITGRIFKGTTVKAPDSSLILKENYTSVSIKEPDDASEKKMIITPLTA
ncbi:putative DUF342 domain-containing protein [Candidatus Magnetomoraceae bacterium gMMP-15]